MKALPGLIGHDPRLDSPKQNRIHTQYTTHAVLNTLCVCVCVCVCIALLLVTYVGQSSTVTVTDTPGIFIGVKRMLSEISCSGEKRVIWSITTATERQQQLEMQRIASNHESMLYITCTLYMYS